MIKEKQCEDCKEMMDYNYSYDCYECSCGATYNLFGQRLRPVQDWQEEYDNDDY